MRVASYIGHGTGEIYELAEAANEVDGNKGILGRDHMPEQGSALRSLLHAATRQPRIPSNRPHQQSQQEEERSHPGGWE